MSFYLDDELHGGELAAFDAHMRDCLRCRESVERERAFLESVRQARPLHTASNDLRARVEKILSQAPAPLQASAEMRARLHRSLESPRSYRLAAAATVITIAAMIGLWYVIYPTGISRPSPSGFAKMAVETHQRHLAGRLPLEVASDSAEEISGWFAGKVSFRLKLPDYQGSSGQEKLYDLKGARLVAFNNDYAAYIAYQMRARPISLVVTSESVARASGGEEIVSKGLTFHYDAIDGLKVITWSDRGLTYALVSDLEERGQQSCLVCHAGTKDRDFIEGLKPKGF
jgi:anti-sigma factor RsiW